MKLFKPVLLLILLTITLCTVKIQISKTTFDKTFEKLIPYIIHSISPIKLPDNQFQMTAIRVAMENTTIDFINPDSPNQFKLVLKAPNRLILKLTNLKANGKVNIVVQSPIYNENKNIKLDITNLSLEVELVIDSFEEGSRRLPSVYVERVVLDKFDFDFDISGSYLATIGNVFKDRIRFYINNKLGDFIKQDFKQMTKGVVEQAVRDMPLSFPLVKDVQMLLNFPSTVRIEDDGLTAEIDIDYFYSDEARAKVERDRAFDEIKTDL
jgi:hypothetical protein